MVKKVLIIAYQFPPRSGPGVFRTLNLVKYLQEFNYQPIVLTTNNKYTIDEGGKIDNSLLNEIPDFVEVHRTKSYSLSKVSKFLMKVKLYRLVWFILFPLFWEWSNLWSFLTLRKALSLIKNEKIDIIYTTSGPFSSMHLGWLLKLFTGKPWVADLRDPLTDAYNWMYPSKMHWHLTRLWEIFFFNKPSTLIVNTESVKDLFIKRGLRKDNIVVINNGF